MAGGGSILMAIDSHIEQLEKANARLSRELEIANGCLDLQKKPYQCSII